LICPPLGRRRHAIDDTGFFARMAPHAARRGTFDGVTDSTDRGREIARNTEAEFKICSKGRRIGHRDIQGRDRRAIKG